MDNILQNEQLQQKLRDLPMYKVVSSNINYLGYDKDLKILKVIFKNNSSYAYFGVSEIIWQDLVKAESKGKYLTENVVKRKDMYKFIKIR